MDIDETDFLGSEPDEQSGNNDGAAVRRRLTRMFSSMTSVPTTERAQSRRGQGGRRRSVCPGGGRRASIAGRRGSGGAFSSESLPLGLEDGNAFPGSGFLVDFMMRKLSKSVRARIVDDASAQRALVDALMKGAAEPGFSVKAGEFAFAMLQRERLRNDFMENITRECKERKMFGETGAVAFRHWAHFLQKTKRQIVQLRACVQHWQFTWQITHLRVPNDPQSMWEKKGELDEFWSAYHDRSRILDAGVKTSPKASAGCASPFPKSPFESPSAMKRRNSHDRGGGAPPCGLKWEFDQVPTWKALNKAKSGKSGKGLGTSTSLPTLHGGRPAAQAMSAADMAMRPMLSSTSRPGTSHRPGTSQRPGSRASMLRGMSQASVSALPPITAGKTRYLQECDSRMNPPRALPVVMGHAPSISAARMDLMDNELLAIAAMVQEMQRLDCVDLSHNALVTDRSLVQLMKSLLRDPVRMTLQRLILSDCVKAGSHMLDGAVKLLKSGGVLRQLDLSRVMIPAQFQLPLCQAIGKHPALETVSLAETGFTHHGLSKQCLIALLAGKLKSLDMSWNTFNGDVFDEFGRTIVKSSRLRSLRVANCASVTDVGSANDFVPPLSRFLEHLSHDKALTLLDISMNRCDFKTALILEDSLDTHTKLKELILTNNPLGTLGMRSILRLLSRDHTGLISFETEGCYMGTSAADDDGVPVFAYTNPGGKYSLQLWRPYHRSLLRMLYKQMVRFGLETNEAFDQIQYKLKGRPTPWTHATQDAIGVWQVPQEGDVSVVFQVEKAIFKKFMHGDLKLEDGDFAGFLENYLEEARFRPGLKKIVPLLGRFALLQRDEFAKKIYIDALAKDFTTTLPALEYMCEVSPMSASSLVWKLLPSVPGGCEAQYITGMIFRNPAEFAKTHFLMQNFTNLNVHNPTGHYKVDLANCSDYAVAERILLMDRWEAAVDQKYGRKDTSNRGNRSHIRNEVFQGRKLGAEYASVAEWKLPEHGDFEFDYISNMRPRKTQKVLSDELWETILIELYNSVCPDQDRIAALRSISHTFYLRSSHIRALIGYFKTEQQRADILIIFYLRIVDMHNAKLFRVRFENPEEVIALQARLGYASFFPFLQPESAKFELNFAVYDQRLAATLFVQLAIKEKYQNLREYGYTRASGVEDPLPLGVPKSWADMKTVPTDGVFRGVYRCAPEDRNFGLRKELARTYGFFDVDGLTDRDVEWWTGLTEPPPDVLNMLEFFINKYDNIDQPFLAIDGVDGNGFITLQEMKDGLDEMQCHKFDTKGKSSGPTKLQRIESIFRYLDPGGEGSVSREEWAIMGQLWKEFDCSMREFVHFLTLSCGDDLRDAWEALDEDGSDEINEEEWREAADRIGYFGPAHVVFDILDETDDGNISWQEFQVLEKYKPKRGLKT